ncbi:MAG TPA: magnesium-translocating P-type ATPase [Myxococcaceae bacterium]|nr:magnesium-translocating P-type ATPase [Myxococcaceae bacterium]
MLEALRRFPIFKSMTQNKTEAASRTVGQRQVSDEVGKRLREACCASPNDLLTQLGTTPQGLTAAEAEERLEKYGPNRVASERPPHWYVQLGHSITNPFVLLLLVLAAVSFIAGDTQATIIIATMVAIGVSLRFYQERRSTVAAEKLRALVKVTATVIRRDLENHPYTAEVPIEQLVPGDIIQLAAGDMIPADVRLLSSKDLFISQAVLTGEAMPVEKFAPLQGAPEGSVLEAPNACFLGTNVISGSATAVVVGTGPSTYLGSIARSITGQRTLTSFEKGIRDISILLIRFTLVMAVLVFIINGISKHNWPEAFMFALSVAVGLTPEMLPMIVSGALALGAVTMSKKKVIVKRLNSIQNIGAIDILCTDKTGTLTEDRVVLMRCWNVAGEEDTDVFTYAYLNSYFQTGLKNLLDRAILDYRDAPKTVAATKVDEIPFDFSRRLMSVVVDRDQRRELVVKGAPETIFARCNQFDLNGEVMEMDPVLLPELQEELDKLNLEGFRTLAIAYKDVSKTQQSFSKNDEGQLTLKGYVAFLDPPKQTARAAITALSTHGVQVKILTGDNDIVTRTICHQVGLGSQEVVRGGELEAMTDEELRAVTEKVSVFARLTPAHKERVIRVLRDAGHVVGFMGDGINDAPALRAADIGISVDNAVDIAKESADLILLEKSLLVLEDGVLEGRRVFGNIQKYIKMGTSSNFGNMFSVLGASIFLPFLPMLPIQLLVQNLLYDFSQLAIPFDRVDEEYLRKPRRWRVAEIGRFMLYIGPISSIFDYTTYGLMFYVFAANTVAKQSLFQSGWFVEGLLSQTLIVHMIRTRKIPFIQSRAAWPLVLTTILVMAIGIYLPFSPIAPGLHMTPLPHAYFAYLPATLLSYAILTQIVKTWFAGRYGYN